MVIVYRWLASLGVETCEHSQAGRQSCRHKAAICPALDSPRRSERGHSRLLGKSLPLWILYGSSICLLFIFLFIDKNPRLVCPSVPRPPPLSLPPALGILCQTPPTPYVDSLSHYSRSVTYLVWVRGGQRGREEGEESERNLAEFVQPLTTHP